MVTGAPGSGKSLALESFVRLRSPYLAFDIDWLARSASDLSGRDIFLDRSTWRPYAALWFDVLHAVYRNGRVPVFFTPNDPSDFATFGLPQWCSSVEWLLLDCPDDVRRERLARRGRWTDEMVAEAVEDARRLREVVERRVDTARLSHEEVALAILSWLKEAGGSG